MEWKRNIEKIIKSKLTYIVIGGLVIMQSAFKVNEDHNQDLLNQYYGQNAKIDKASVISSKKEVKRATVQREDLVEYAKEYLGRPYKYAAKGPNSFDCSGYTSFVYRKFDIVLPVSSQLQATKGEAIELKDVQPGDLLAFKSPTKGIERVGHVGIVVSNDAEGIKFIHSSTGRGVIIDNLTTSKHYTSRFRGARRVF